MCVQCNVGFYTTTTELENCCCDTHLTSFSMFGAFRNYLNLHMTRKTWRREKLTSTSGEVTGRLQVISSSLTSWRASCRWRCIPSRRPGSPWPLAPSGGCSLAGCPGCSRGQWRPCHRPAQWWKPWGCPRTAAAASGNKGNSWVFSIVLRILKGWKKNNIDYFSAFYFYSSPELYVLDLDFIHFTFFYFNVMKKKSTVVFKMLMLSCLASSAV